MDSLSPDFRFQQRDFLVGDFQLVKQGDGQKAFVVPTVGVHVISLSAEREFVVVGAESHA